MFRCPTCGRTYKDESIRFCLNDGIELVDASVKNSCTLAEARSEFGLSRSVLFRAIALRKLKVRRIGGQWRVKRSDLLSYFHERD